jgi:hypothetical protein
MNKTSGGIIILLLLVISGGIYKFIFQGSTSPSTDGRSSIHLNADERDLVLTEMRAFLNSVQKITQGISEDDMPLVAEYARLVGKAAQGEVPGTLVGKLPLAFKKMGFDTHTKFDQLAMDADDLGDSNYALVQLSGLMQNCVTCHASYRIDITPK